MKMSLSVANVAVRHIVPLLAVAVAVEEELELVALGIAETVFVPMANAALSTDGAAVPMPIVTPTRRTHQVV